MRRGRGRGVDAGGPAGGVGRAVVRRGGVVVGGRRRRRGGGGDVAQGMGGARRRRWVQVNDGRVGRVRVGRDLDHVR